MTAASDAMTKALETLVDLLGSDDEDIRLRAARDILVFRGGSGR